MERENNILNPYEILKTSGVLDSIMSTRQVLIHHHELQQQGSVGLDPKLVNFLTERLLGLYKEAENMGVDGSVLLASMSRRRKELDAKKKSIPNPFKD